jgi:pimeloyl-ACP methyl ester carboxylesterase
MTDHPLLLPTSAGVLGAVVSEPEGDPRAAALLFEGYEGRRFGVNRVWTATGWDLAKLGITTLRVDYPGWGDSAFIPVQQYPTEPMRQALAWFRERLPERLPLLLIGACWGARLAAAVAADEPGVAGLALINPYVRLRPSKRFPARARRLLDRAMGRSPRARWDRSTEDVMRAAFHRVPTLAIVAEDDGRTPAMLALAEMLRGEGVPVEVQRYRGSGNRTLEGQERGRARIVAWARSAVLEPVSVSR